MKDSNKMNNTIRHLDNGDFEVIDSTQSNILFLMDEVGEIPLSSLEDIKDYANNLSKVAQANNITIMSSSQVAAKYQADQAKTIKMMNGEHADTIGMTFEEFKEYCSNNDISWRISKNNQTYMVSTRDYHPDRLNITLLDDIVIDCLNG